MLQASRSGFTNAPFSKGLLLAVLLFNFMRAIVGRGKLEFTTGSSLVLSIFQYALSGHLVFSSNVELLFGCIAVYFFRLFERNWGTQKFAVSIGVDHRNDVV